ncbi:MAG: hypothetical protein ACREE9_04230 [Stellaceae bacterium]
MDLVVEISKYFTPLSFALPQRAPKLAELDLLLIEARAELREQTKLFDQLVAATAAEIDADPNDFIEVASLVYDRQAADEARLQPVIERLQTILVREAGSLNSDARQRLRDGVDLLVDWLALHKDVRAALLVIANKRRSADRLLRARPVEGEINYAQLSREHIARYPKIRARLAE